MEVKKSPKADLEGKKSTWLLIGYVFILALMFVAFEWTDRDKQVTTETGITDVVFEESRDCFRFLLRKGKWQEHPLYGIDFKRWCTQFIRSFVQTLRYL